MSQVRATCNNTEGSFTCACDAGYADNGTDYKGVTCTPCTPGQFKAVNGSGACEACAGGSYLNVTAGTVCLACPANTDSLMGSDAIGDCTCNTGYESSNGGVTCTDVDECGAGSHTCDAVQPDASVMHALLLYILMLSDVLT